MIDARKAGRYRVFAEAGVLAEACDYSPSLLFRMRGLLGRSAFAGKDGILLLPCNSIHMFFMSFPIDAFFLDRAGKVVALYPSIQPWKLSKMHWDSHAVLETRAGRAEHLGIKEGDWVNFELLS